MRCRLCLYECKINNSVPLFDHDGESHLNKLIAKYIKLEITEDDSCSTMVCQRCAKQLSEFDEFFLFIENRQAELQNEFLEVKCILNGDAQFTANDFKSEVTKNFFNNEESLLDIKEVLIEETMHPSAMAQKEFGFAENSCDSNQSDSNNRSENKEINNLDEDDKNLLLRKPVRKTKTQRPKPTKNSTKKRGRPKKNTKKLTTDKDINNEDNNDEKTKTNKKQYSQEENKLRDELIKKHVHLKCEICDSLMDSMNELRIHFRQQHNTKAYIVCCGKRFHRRFELVDHVKLHLNPEQFKCEICNRLLSSQVSLQLHHTTFHTKTLERKHVCTVCGRRFGLLNNLNAHMLSHIDTRDFICQICNKGFKAAKFLKSHITHVHENLKPFICEICGKEYKTKAALDFHSAEHNGIQNQLTEQCPICNKWFRSNGLRFHMARHDLKDVKCSFCGKILKSKMALKGHIRYWHMDRKTHKCTFCDREFKKPCALREHIAMHTGQKDYNCPHCPREFRSRANMYAHIKKIHFQQWTEAQLARNRGPIEIVEKT